MKEQAAANDMVDYDRIGRFIYAFHRMCGSVETLSDTAQDANAPRELKDRAARLARNYEHILANIASTADSELESTLRLASEVRAEIDNWRSV